MNITEDYVSFEVAKLLKEKGFNEYCRAFWKDWDSKIILCNATRSHVFDFCNNQMLEKEFCSCDETNIAAPTLQMTMKWLEKEKHIAIIPVLSSILDNEKFLWDVKIVVAETGEKYSQGWVYEDKESAYDAAIKYCLENLI